MSPIKAIRLSILAVTAIPAFAAGTNISGTVIFEGKPPTPPILDTRGEQFCKTNARDPSLTRRRRGDRLKRRIRMDIRLDRRSPGSRLPRPREVRLPQPEKLSLRTASIGANDRTETHDPQQRRHHSQRPRIPEEQQNLQLRTTPRSTPPHPHLQKSRNAPENKMRRSPWMKSYAFVMDHPFFAVTDNAGKFKIDNLPAAPTP